LSDIIFRADETILKQSYPHVLCFELTQEAKMSRLVFAIALLAVASAGISASFAAVHQARALTFAERFAPALPLMVKH
jgi:amino acid permease